MSGNGAIIGDYVIDWFLNDILSSIQFTTGSALSADPDVSIAHPFTGEPAQGGSWIPVIRFIYINGTKYNSNLISGENYSPDLQNCLTNITILSYSCINPPIINYNNAGHAGKAYRNFSINLESSTQYFAWTFVGYDVYDTIKISYNGTDVLEYWSVGSNMGDPAQTPLITDLTVSPKIYYTPSASGWAYEIDRLRTITNEEYINPP